MHTVKTTTERTRNLKTVTYQGFRVVQVIARNTNPRFARPALWAVMKRGSADESLDSAVHADPRPLQDCVDLIDRLDLTQAINVLGQLTGTNATAGKGA